MAGFDGLGLFPVEIDVYKKHKVSTINAHEDDANGRGLLVTLLKDGVPFNTTGIDLKLAFRNAIGEERLFAFNAVDLTNGKYSVTYPREMLEGNGGRVVRVEIKAYDTATQAMISYSPLNVYVSEAVVTEGQLVTNSEGSEFVQLLERVETVETGLGNLDPVHIDNVVTLSENAVQAEADRVLAESGRVSAESSRASAESGRASAESARATAESDRVSAESSRVSSENARVLSESARTSSEDTRVLSESDRVSAETTRATAEGVRANAESNRQTAESARVVAESSRVNAESARSSNEAERILHEDDRVADEALRASAEATRASNETARGTAETSRVNAESARATAESLRVTAETGRVNAESSRVNAESSRVSAEQGRVTAEQTRASFYDGFTAQLAETEQEIIDARIGADGLTYPNAGGAIRGQIGNIASFAPNYNLINPSEIEDGYFYSFEKQIGNYSITGYVPVEPSTAYTFGVDGYNYFDIGYKASFIAYFNSNKQYIKYDSNTSNFTTPSNAKFIIITFVKNARNITLCKGTYNRNLTYVEYNPNIVEIELDKIVGLKTNGKNFFDKNKAQKNKILNSWNELVDNNSYFTSDFISVKKDVSYVISQKVLNYILYDFQKQRVSYQSVDSENVVVTPIQDGYIRYCGYSNTIELSMIEEGTSPTYYEEYKDIFQPNIMLNKNQLNNVSSALYINNVLNGKKWAACGDSFTDGATDSKLSEGKYKGYSKTYPYFIGNRTGIDVLKFNNGGQTLAYPSDGTFTNSLTNPNGSRYYQNIPQDVDYITIQLGINDESHRDGISEYGEEVTGVIPLGTITDNDTSTYYGAWNVVLTWLIINRPFAHIGMIVTNGLSDIAYRTAQLEIAKKYGIPYIDLNGDVNTPAMIRSVNPNISADVKSIIKNKQAVDVDGSKTGTINTHPNDDAHEYESYFIEDFLKRI